jgi:hypothetical protein
VKPDTIYVVWADRGAYSDRTEYAVCWYENEEYARERAESLTALSAEWQRRIFNSGSSRYGAIWEEAKKAVGDEQWGPTDDTSYSVVELKRGG